MVLFFFFCDVYCTYNWLIDESSSDSGSAVEVFRYIRNNIYAVLLHLCTVRYRTVSPTRSWFMIFSIFLEWRPPSMTITFQSNIRPCDTLHSHQTFPLFSQVQANHALILSMHNHLERRGIRYHRRRSLTSGGSHRALYAIKIIAVYVVPFFSLLLSVCSCPLFLPCFSLIWFWYYES